MRRLMMVIIVISMLLVGCKKKEPNEVITLYEDMRLGCYSRFRVLSVHDDLNNSTSDQIIIIEDTETGIKYLCYSRFAHQFGITRLWEK